MAAATKIKAAPARQAPKPAPRTAAPAEAPHQEAVAEAPRMPTPPVVPPPMQVRVPAGRAVAIGRDGKPIWRQSAQGGTDLFGMAKELEPPDWVYEWKRYSVMGQVDHAYHAQLARVGKWTPVMAETLDGIFLPPGSTGSIIIDGLILMERPKVLHDEALQDEHNAANDVMRKARAERGLQVPGGVTGVSTQTPAAQSASFVNVTRAFASQEDREALAAIPKPAYDYDRNTID